MSGCWRTRRAPHRDVRRFSTRAGCPLEKSPRRRLPGFALGTKRFLWFRFFDAHQRNELGRAAGETLLIFALLMSVSKQQQDQTLSPSATSFLLIGVKRNEAKKNALCQEHTRPFVDEGIFREGILPSSKNGAHPCAPPSGSADILCAAGSLASKARSGKGEARARLGSRLHGANCMRHTRRAPRWPQRGLAGIGNGVTTFSPDAASRIADCPFFSTSSTRTMLCIGRCRTRVLPNSSRRRSSVGSTTTPSCTSNTSSPTSVKPQIPLATTRRAYSS